VSADPALGFWLRHAENEGALHERVGAVTTVVLPDTLRTEYGLPEEVTLTADPEVAREDEALLLAPGHPLLDAAAQRVLERGDVGRVTLAWPSTSMPSAAVLIERLRQQVHIDHGRIDGGREPPTAAYQPLLRVGALVTYTVTLEDRFQERQETWVDPTTGLPLPTRDAAILSTAARSLVLTHPILPVDRDAAAAAAQAALIPEAAARLAALAGQSRIARETEVARIGDYYRAALQSLARRRAAAPPDRGAMLDARAEATRAEWERRLAEVEEKFRGSFDLKWFRLHEVLVPALVLPVLIRRGHREYPFTFRWLLPLQTVVATRCPHCGATSSLVAGKERLGCAVCLPKLSSVPEPPAAETAVAAAEQAPVGLPASAAPPQRSAVEPAAVELPASTSPPPQRSETEQVPASTPPPQSSTTGASRSVTGRATAPAPQRRQPPPSAPRSRPPTPRPPGVPVLKQLAGDGNRLAVKFWEDVARQDRRVGRLVVSDSPVDTSLRLWGTRGPAIVVGLPADEQPSHVEVHTAPNASATVQTTSGWLRTDQRDYPFRLRWQGGPGRPGVTQVGEVIGGSRDLDRRAPSSRRPWLPFPAPAPALPPARIELDPVAAALWDVEPSRGGLPSLLRCLASWWQAETTIETTSRWSGTAVAAAVARLVAAQAGTQVTINEMARQYDVDPAAVRAAGTVLRRSLQL